MKRFHFLFCFLLSSFVGYGQETWYFGNGAGLIFSNNTATATVTPTTGATNVPEGTSIASDVNGNVIFYTDGIKIFNAAHTHVNAGSPLFGNPSSTHSSIIVPKPGACDTFFVFTVDAIENRGTNFKGMRVSTVVRTGSGATASVALVPGQVNILLQLETSEKLAVTPRPNGGYWLVGHARNSNTFWSYPIDNATHITSSGTFATSLPSTFVTSVAGDLFDSWIQQPLYVSNSYSEVGQIKFSPDGTKIALVNHLPRLIGLYHFDEQTGVVSIPPSSEFGEITDENAFWPHVGHPYGVEFSDNGNVFYITGDFSDVVQFDITSSAWLNWQTNPFNSIGLVTFCISPYGGMQRGPNGVIYIAQFGCNGLTTIDNPNILGVGCSLNNSGITLATGTTAGYGMPNVTVGCNNMTPPNPCANDSTPPSLVCPANIIRTNDPGQCGAIVTFSPTATDSCAVTITSNPASGSLFPVGTTTVTVIATDGNGNADTCSFTVTVNDVENPDVSMQDITAYADSASCGANVNFTIPATDNCGVASIVTSKQSGDYFAVGTTNVTIQVTDIHANISNSSFNIVVVDTIKPVIMGCQDIVAYVAAGQCNAPVNYNITFSDNCALDNPYYSIVSGSVFPVGTTNVFVSIKDIYGNKSICEFTVTVLDTIAPVISCPSNITAVGTNLNGTCSAVITFPTPTATDNCSAIVTTVPASGSIFPDGLTTVVATAIDPSGNIATCTFDVNVACSYPPIYEVENDTITCTEACTCCGNTPKVCIPLVATSAVPNGIIGMDFCMSYDQNLVHPTGNATLGQVVLASTNNPATDAAFSINTQFTNPGELHVSIYYTGGIYNFTGAGDIICVEFELLPTFTAGQTTCFGICELIESYQSNILFSSATTGCLTFENDSVMEGRVIFWDKQNKPLDDSPTADVNGTDANCNAPSPIVAQTDALGYFNYNISNGVDIQINREIGATNVMSIVNGYDCNLTSLVTTVNNIYFPNPYQMIAMDVNLDGNVSAGDITLIQQRIVLNTTDYNAQGKDWQFTDVPTVTNDASYQISTNFPSPDAAGGYYRFNVPTIPNCMPVQVTQNGLICTKIDSQEFRGILLGDVNGNWTNASLLKTSATDDIVFDLTQATKDKNTCAVRIPVYYQSTNNLLSLDFDMDYDQTALQIIGVSQDANAPTNLMMMSNNYQSDRLMLTSYLNGSMNGVNYNTNPIFWIEVQTPGASQTVLTDAMLGNILAYFNGDPANAVIVGTIADCNTLNTTDIDATIAAEVSVYPQPVNDILTITYPTNLAQLALFDAQGKFIQNIEINADGKSNIDMSALANGVYFLQINGQFTKKIIR